MPWSSATRLRLKSFVRIALLRARARATSFASTSLTSGTSSSMISTGVGRFLLHPGEDLEAAPAAVAAERVGAVGDVLELFEDELRHDERPVDEPGLDDLGDPAVDDRARVDDDVGVAGCGRGLRRRPRPADEADRLGGEQQVLALGDGQPEHPETEEQRHAERQPRPQRPVERPTAGRPSSRPMSRPSRSPTTAVTNSAVDSCWTPRNSHGPARRSGTAGSRSRRRARRRSSAISQMPPLGVTSRPPPGVVRSSPAGLASPAPPGRRARCRAGGCCGSRVPRSYRSRDPMRMRDPRRHGRQPSIVPGRSLHARRVPRACGSLEIASRSDADARRSRCRRTLGQRRRAAAGARDDRPPEAEPGGLAQAPLEARRRAAARRAARPRRSPPCRSLIGRSRSDEARARASGRSSAGLARLTARRRG